MNTTCRCPSASSASSSQLPVENASVLRSVTVQPVCDAASRTIFLTLLSERASGLNVIDVPPLTSAKRFSKSGFIAISF